MQHLSQLGHQRIGYIKSIERIPNLDERYESFQSAIKQFDLAEEFSQYSISSNHLGVNASFQKWFSQLEEAKRPTALLCENDYLAISVVKSLLDMDIKVPSQVSVVGFDNIVESIVLTPELSTVHVDKEQMAIKSVERLKTIMANEEVSIKVTIDTKFIARKSTDFI